MAKLFSLGNLVRVPDKTVWIVVGLGALGLLSYRAGGVLAQSAQNPANPEADSRVSQAERLSLPICPESLQVGRGGFRGPLPAGASLHQRHCGVSGRWTYFRMTPELRSAVGDIEIWWESFNPMHVVIGWGSCHAPAKICPRSLRPRIEDWPSGASMWVAVLDPSAPAGSTDAGSSSTSASSGHGRDDVTTSSASSAGPRHSFSLGWRAVAKP